jgi:hypothetical protein
MRSDISISLRLAFMASVAAAFDVAENLAILAAARIPTGTTGR